MIGKNDIEDNNFMDIPINKEDLPYEEEILRNPYSVKHWQRYIDHLKSTKSSNLNVVYERALKELPGSYKIWYNYLRQRVSQLKGRCITDPLYEDVNNAFERALVFMHKMPRIWMDYCTSMTEQCYITRSRQVFDRALRALPITQHHRIWPLYIDFLKKHNVYETAVRVFRRYLKLAPEDTEEYIEYLISVGRLDEAAVKLAQIVNQDDFVSKHGKSNHQLWNELCDLISKNPSKIKSLNVDAIIRGGLRRYTDQLGPLWNSLADYYVRSGLFERARDIYEEAIQTVTTVRDFTQVFDAYAQFEELSLSKRMEEAANNPNPTEEDDIELELRLARFEHLMERRLLLLNSVLLRQNPHNVQEWHKRVMLYEGQPHEIINTYTEAVQTVQPQLAVGKLHTLWVAFAKFYEENGQIPDARVVLEKATHVPYTKVDDLASVWCEWAEMEIRHGNCKEALKLMHRATAMPSRKVAYHDETETVQMRLYKSLKVWSMYADLEESFGTFKTCKAVYDKIIDLKIATPQIIINYGLFLEENNYFEEAFRAYEKGIALFKWPNVYDIWNTYLTKFLKRYGGTKVERTRDLFEQCLEYCPPKYAKALYLLYAKLEEDHGLARHAMSVYERATSAVLPEQRFEMFNIYIKKAADIYGVPKTRQIYEKAIEVLNEENTREMCLRFAEMETKLGEVDRARAIYAHCSQICDPRVTSNFWQVWKEFEIRHGNEDTMREMLRIKRSVQAMYNTQVNMMSAQMLNTASNPPSEQQTDAMRLLDSKASSGADAATPVTSKEGIQFVRGVTVGGEKSEARVVNPDVIDFDAGDLDMDTDGENENDEAEVDEDIPVEKQAIPSKVFGSLKTKEDEGIDN
ncbi:pre-mRNA-splicing factor SYF1 [Cephus cinctus]|uniref:Pre-mRNA-splicing factor SYF1 n=1 Tax=Cephus cinctus TaxID=211228 RepID=A0AAJ7BN06_CEPCN|nr:pre-mRNA-splicing factor SYF1 [Cephus cinctus]XP_015589715.1 pre-mRNA-splicing factor SYF1 [Cephus cinctus]XP_024938092.1 pre-mRNA-splicing factor SYF1 [Cephus cinctus]